MRGLAELEKMVNEATENPTKLHTLIIELAKEPLMPFIRAPNTIVNEWGTCTKDPTHNAQCMRHWDGEKYDDTHYLCMECGVSMKLCKDVLKGPCKFVHANGQVRWPGAGRKA